MLICIYFAFWKAGYERCVDNLYDKWILQTSYAKGWQNKNFGSDKTPSLKLKLMSENLLGGTNWMYCHRQNLTDLCTLIKFRENMTSKINECTGQKCHTLKITALDTMMFFKSSFNKLVLAAEKKTFGKGGPPPPSRAKFPKQTVFFPYRRRETQNQMNFNG